MLVPFPPFRAIKVLLRATLRSNQSWAFLRCEPFLRLCRLGGPDQESPALAHDDWSAQTVDNRPRDL